VYAFLWGSGNVTKTIRVSHEETPMCGMLTFVEELSLEEDLAVSDRDDIGGNKRARHHKKHRCAVC
jgi:hypothetical protein